MLREVETVQENEIGPAIKKRQSKRGNTRMEERPTWWGRENVRTIRGTRRGNRGRACRLKPPDLLWINRTVRKTDY